MDQNQHNKGDNCFNFSKHVRGQEVAHNFKSKNKFFVVYITQAMLSMNMLFNVLNIDRGDAPRHDIILRFMGREWKLVFTKYKHNQLGCIGVGWNSFKKEIGLQAGMVVVFEVVSDEQPPTLEVHLF